MPFIKTIPQYLSRLLDFFLKNFTSLVPIITVISLVFNFVQIRTKDHVNCTLESIIISCKAATARNQKERMSNAELMHIIDLLRVQAISGLRLIGSNQTYAIEDSISLDRPVHDFFQDVYRTLLEIREKAPNLWRRRPSGTEQHESFDKEKPD